MKITIIAVGKLKEKYWTQACTEYIKRIKIFSHINIIEVKDIDTKVAGGPTQAKLKEGAQVLKKIPSDCYVIALCINSKQYSSIEFSQKIQELTLHGINHITFIIGGSTGLSQEVINIANESISFGKITLPHNLARVVLLEQIYRNFKITQGHAYHK